MNSCDFFPHSCPDPESCESGAVNGRLEPSVRIRALAERDRRRLLMHFLSLNSEDRRLRFGAALSNEALTQHVQHIDFHRDVLFGAYDDASTLVGVGHLAFVPHDVVPEISAVTSKGRLAEAGLSVLEPERGKGIGMSIFARMVMRCRSEDVDTIMVHCLADNQAMMHIMRKTGMAIRFGNGESDACLKLPPDEGGITSGQQTARFDDAMRQAAAFLKGRRR